MVSSGAAACRCADSAIRADRLNAGGGERSLGSRWREDEVGPVLLEELACPMLRFRFRPLGIGRLRADWNVRVKSSTSMRR